MKKILWLCWQPTPYHHFLFENVSRRFHLDVIFLKKKLQTHPWQMTESQAYRSFYLSDPNKAVLFRMLWSPVYRTRIITGWDHSFFIATLFICVLTRSKYCIWTDTPNSKQTRTFLKRQLHKILIARFVGRASAILVTGQVGVRNFIQIYPNAKRLVNFPTATNLDFFKPGLTKFEIPTFCTVGRLVNSHKGMDVALRAVAVVVKRAPNLKFQFKIIGSGPDFEVISSLIIELKLQGKVEVIQWINQEDLLRFYQQSLFLLHSSHFDPYPNTIMEAMACGLAVVSSTAAGSSERIVHGKHGLLVSDGDVELMANHIQFLLENPVIALEYGRNARIVAETWSVDYNLGEIDKLV